MIHRVDCPHDSCDGVVQVLTLGVFDQTSCPVCGGVVVWTPEGVRTEPVVVPDPES